MIQGSPGPLTLIFTYTGPLIYSYIYLHRPSYILLYLPTQALSYTLIFTYTGPFIYSYIYLHRPSYILLYLPTKALFIYLPTHRVFSIDKQFVNRYISLFNCNSNELICIYSLKILRSLNTQTCYHSGDSRFPIDKNVGKVYKILVKWLGIYRGLIE